MKLAIPLIIFWICTFVILYTYAGFPVLTAIRAALFPRKLHRGSRLQSVSLIIVAHNEVDVIGEKLKNVFSLDFPPEFLEVIVASDGSDDGTDDVVASYKNAGVKLLSLPRAGKNVALNAAVSEARNEVLVFSDADSMLERDALRRLLEPLADPSVGCVAGDYRYVKTAKAGKGERGYWSYDRLLKRMQSIGGNVTSATGQIYAIRRELARTVPIFVTDDFYLSSQAVAAGLRIVFEPSAIAHGPLAESAKAEFQRKVRVMTRGLRSVWQMRRLLNPMQHGFYSLQLFSHKVLRRMMFLPLIGLFLSSLMLWNAGPLYKYAAMIQVFVHGLALLGFLIRDIRSGAIRVLCLPFYFDMVNAASARAFFNLIARRSSDRWAPRVIRATKAM